jgi:hypothetical protein
VGSNPTPSATLIKVLALAKSKNISKNSVAYDAEAGE